MSKEQITKLLEDITKNPSEWTSNRDAVIGRYELTDAEQTALRSGDDSALISMGVDERLVKRKRFH
ncbi:MAG TPA: hypothetical protein VMR52_14290 [Dehalococcoidia bacterium]|nr:hypothetical protein [Dehalococcoidia bacterium]